MKVAILAGGMGTRLGDVTRDIPKPMIEIGSRPILWHIMKHYSHFGFREFVIALGHKSDVIKRYFLQYGRLHGDLSVDVASGAVRNRDADVEDWAVDLVETGATTSTGGRVRRLGPWLGNGTFMLTWGDGVSDVDIRRLLEFHRSHGRLATVTAVHPPGRFGVLSVDGHRVASFTEKPRDTNTWINGAFFVLEPGVLDYIEGDDTQFEREPLEGLARDGQLMAYFHDSFWQCMDTLKEKQDLEAMWQSGRAPWKVW